MVDLIDDLIDNLISSIAIYTPEENMCNKSWDDFLDWNGCNLNYYYLLEDITNVRFLSNTLAVNELCTGMSDYESYLPDMRSIDKVFLESICETFINNRLRVGMSNDVLEPTSTWDLEEVKGMFFHRDFISLNADNLLDDVNVLLIGFRKADVEYGSRLTFIYPDPYSDILYHIQDGLDLASLKENLEFDDSQDCDLFSFVKRKVDSLLMDRFAFHDDSYVATTISSSFLPVNDANLSNSKIDECVSCSANGDYYMPPFLEDRCQHVELMALAA